MDVPLLNILYQDDVLVAVDKPSGMFVHRSRDNRHCERFIVQDLRDQIGQFVYPLHRLDRGTSGILLFSLTQDVASIMGKMFAERKIRKTYQALVRGFCAEFGTVDQPMTSAKARTLAADDPRRTPQAAVTDFICRRRFDVPVSTGRFPSTRLSLLELHPLTGRFHQIRRHLNYIAHPVIGDSSHGDTRVNRVFRDTFGFDRLMLTAVRLEFPHPLTREPVVIVCEPDESFRQCVEVVAPFEQPL